MVLLSAGMRVFPLSWEMRFMVWAALGHVAAGIMIGVIAYRFGGRWPAMLAILMWSATTMNVLPFFRAATIPQLWSVFFLLLAMERFLKGSVIIGTLALVATYYAHPISFAVGALAASVTLPAIITYRWVPRSLPRRIIACIATATAGAAVLLVFRLFPFSFPFAGLAWDEPWHNMLRLLSTHYGPVMMLAPVGFAVIATTRRIPIYSRLTLLTFGILGIVLSINDMFGGEIPVKRFIPYSIAAIAVFGAIGLHHLVRTITPIRWMKAVITAAVLAIVLINGWNVAKSAYQDFESGCRVPYTCPVVRKAEREAYDWIRTNLPEHAVVAVGEGRGRAAEWIPVLAKRSVAAPHISGDWVSIFFSNSCIDIYTVAHGDGISVTHILFYKTGERVPETYSERPELFPVAYENEDVIVITFPSRADLTDAQEKGELCN